MIIKNYIIPKSSDKYLKRLRNGSLRAPERCVAISHEKTRLLRYTRNDIISCWIRSNNKGVTLVEVMIALVIFLIVFMGLMQTALLSIDGNVRNVQRDEAITLANGELDNLRNIPFDSLSVGTTCSDDNDDKYKRKFRNLVKQYKVCDTITNLPDPDGTVNTRSIAVVVGWNHKNETAAQAPTNREFQHSISTVRRRS